MQGVVGEFVGDGRQRFAGANCAERLRGGIGCGERVVFGQRPQAAPDAVVGAAVEVQAVAAAGKQHHRVFFGVGFFRALFRQGGGGVVPVGIAVGGDRACVAARATAGADAVAKIHQALGVAAQGGGVVRQARFGLVPEGGERRRLVGRAVNTGVAGKQAFDVAIEDGFFLAVGEDGDGSGGAAADAF